MNEDVLDLEQVTLQEAPLPPPIQRVLDPGKARMFLFFFSPQHFSLYFLLFFSLFFGSSILHILAFSDESAMATPDPADLPDRLDLSMSSIDMTDTALAMHEEKECDISGVRTCGQEEPL